MDRGTLTLRNKRRTLMIKIKNRCCYTVMLILCGTLFLTGLTGCKSREAQFLIEGLQEAKAEVDAESSEEKTSGQKSRKIQMRRKLIQKTDRMMVAILQSSGKNRQNQMVQMQVMGQEVIPGNILQMLI